MFIPVPKSWHRLLAVWVGLLASGPLLACPVGEQVSVADYERAALRNADGSRRLKITAWYPAAETCTEVRTDSLGPFVESIPVTRGAEPRSTDRLPTILLSHGFGGAAQAMGWFGSAMALNGYLVIAVDHPGNNGREEMTSAGAAMFFERAGDLETALEHVAKSEALGHLVDRNRVAVAGFSAGGFTALTLAGAKVDAQRLRRFCKAQPEDGVCRPQLEFPVPIDKIMSVLEESGSKQRIRQANQAGRSFDVHAALVMAPAIVQSLDPRSLSAIDARTTFVLGELDTVAPNATNGFVAARLIPGSKLHTVAGAGHYDFLAACNKTGRSEIPFCALQAEAAAAHQAAIDEALVLFGEVLQARQQ